jgi:hypothetical protein
VKNLVGFSIVFGALNGVALYVMFALRVAFGVDVEWLKAPQCFAISALWSSALIGVHMLPRGLGTEGRKLSRVLLAEYEAHFDKLAAVHGPVGAKRIIELEMKETRFGLTPDEDRELWIWAAKGAQAETRILAQDNLVSHKRRAA